VLAYQQEIRELVVEYLYNSIYWPALNVPDFYVLKAFNSEKYVTLEGSGTNIPNAFVLKKDQETTLFLTALLQWRFIGNRSWNFSESTDLLVVASAWILKHQRKIAQYVLGEPILMNKPQAAVYIVASKLILRLINGKIDFTKLGKLQSEEMYDFITESVDSPNPIPFHSDQWLKLSFDIQSYATLINSVFISYFSKATGAGTAGDTSYRFVDIYEVGKALNVLEELKWDIRSLRFDLTQEQIKSFPEIYNLLKKVNERMIPSFLSEIEYISAPIKKLETYLNGDLSDLSLKTTAKKCTEFLHFLNETTNHSYQASEYESLYKVEVDKYMSKDIECLRNLAGNPSIIETMAIMSTVSIINILGLANSFEAFSQLLDKKETQFKSVIDQKTQDSIIENKKKVETLVDHMNMN